MLNVTVNIHFDASKRQSEPLPSAILTRHLSPSRPCLAAICPLFSHPYPPFVPIAAILTRHLSQSRPCLAAIPPSHATDFCPPLRAYYHEFT
jgi:hypothetical protein